jgi:hypothetical protein
MAGPHGEYPRPCGDAIDRELLFLGILEGGGVAGIQMSRQDSFNLGQRGELGELEVDLRVGDLERTDVRGEFSGEGGGGHEADPHRSDLAARCALRNILGPRRLLDGPFRLHSEEDARLSE